MNIGDKKIIRGRGKMAPGKPKPGPGPAGAEQTASDVLFTIDTIAEILNIYGIKSMAGPKAKPQLLPGKPKPAKPKP